MEIFDQDSITDQACWSGDYSEVNFTVEVCWFF